MEWQESFLIGAVISSTDAASMFSILRSKKLALKENTDSLLELESGSNDPFSYMLTVMLLTMMAGEGDPATFARMLALQLVLGGLAGWVCAKVGIACLNRFDFATEGFDSILCRRSGAAGVCAVQRSWRKRLSVRVSGWNSDG